MKLVFKDYVIERCNATNITITSINEITDKETGEKKLREVVRGYYPTLQKALKALLELKIMESEAENVDDMIRAIRDAEEEIMRITSY